MVPEDIGFLNPRRYRCMSQDGCFGSQRVVNGRFKHLKVGGHQRDVVVESNTVADGTEDVEHTVITKGIPETVQAVKENNRALIAPLKGVYDRLKSLMLPQHIVSTVR